MPSETTEASQGRIVEANGTGTSTRSTGAYSGASDHAFRRHPIADSGVSDHPGLPPLSVVS